MISPFARLAALPLALLLVGAAPTEKVIPLPGVDGEALVIPPDSPVQFRGFDKDHVAHFNGRITVSGTFTYGCEIECNAPLKEYQLILVLVPDPALAARLPHWKLRSGDMSLFINGATRLTRAVGTSAQRTALRSGKLDNLHGRVAIVVDHFQAAIVCDSASYSARFVAVAKPVELAKDQLKADHGC
jgi:hypothetical protein